MPGSPDLRDLNPASKEYLEAIFELGEEGQKILQARVGERLGLAPATVSEGIKRMITEGYVVIPSGVVTRDELISRWNEHRPVRSWHSDRG